MTSASPETQAGRSQHGFALMAVLAVMGLTALTLVALLGMMLSTMKIGESQDLSARQLRASDGAVVAAINQLRLSPAAGGDPCLPAIPATGLPVDFDNGSSGANGTPNITTDDVKISVSCSESTTTAPPVSPDGEVKLVGADAGDDSYQGSVPWSTNCASPLSTNCFPWQTALGGDYSPALISALKPTLIHSGSDSLDFNASLQVRRGAAVLRNPLGDPTDTPAVRVGGKYFQGEPGPLGTGDSCGILGGDHAVPAATITSPEPIECGSATARSMVANPPSYRINPSIQTAPACSAGPVVVLRPGRYDQTQVARLNSLFGGACHNKTFLFVRENASDSGSFWFDANTPGAAAADRHALVINDPTSRFVFGAPKGWSAASGAPASAFPKACDPDQPGSSVVLSGRTELRHLAGAVAICPDTSEAGTPLAAVLQEPLVPHAVTVTPVSGDFSPLGSLVSGDIGDVATRKLSCQPTIVNDVCRATATFKVSTSTPGTAQMSSARLSLYGGEHNPVTSIQTRRVSFTITPAAQSGFPACTTPQVDGFPNNNQAATYELLAGPCAALNNEAAFDGAQIAVNLEYRFKGVCVLVTCPIMSETLRLFNVSVDTGVAYATWDASDVTASTADWTSAQSAAADDADGAAMYARECLPIFGDGICDYLPPSIRPEKGRVLKLSGAEITSPSGGLPDSAAIDSLKVLVRYIRQGTIPSSGAGTTVKFTLGTAGGECTGTFSGIANFAHDAAFDIFGQTGNCAGLVQTMGQLRGATLTITVEPECTVDFQFSQWRCLGAIQPRIQHVALMATTNSYRGPVTTSDVTVDVAHGRSFNVFGETFMSHSAVDLHWAGTTTRDPIFVGNLTLNSLGSQMSSGADAGLVCCGSVDGDRYVTLKAHVGPTITSRPVLSVTVVLHKDMSIAISDWKVCSRDDCT